jgi:predicted type IV restriction endonuclease
MVNDISQKSLTTIAGHDARLLFGLRAESLVGSISDLGEGEHMAFQDDLARHIEQIRPRISHCNSEQAAKQALVTPLLQVLGFDVYDPREVRPEYIADFATKKQGQFEKVDYALCRDSQPIVFIECKPVGAELADHDGQLSRYFNATPSVRVALITDGVRLRAFTDLRTPNVMDIQPWLAIDLMSLKAAEIDALKRFRKGDFSADDIMSLAEEMVFYNSMVEFLTRQLREPDESFVRFVAGEMPSAGRVTGRLVERLSPILRKAIQASIVDHVARSFQSPPPPPPSEAPPPVVAAQATPGDAAGGRDGVVTTAEEREAFEMIAQWIGEVAPDARVAFRDSKSYFTLHQDNVRKWFLRAGIERAPKWISLRHIGIEEARRLAPGFEVVDGGGLGDCRLMIGGNADLPKARAAIIAAYRAEAARVGGGEDAA